jgi:predicted nucleic acid-binding protein
MDVRVVIDASIWVSQFRFQDVNHAPTRLWMVQYTTVNGLMIAPAFLLIEVAAAISRRTGEPALAKKAIEDLNGADIIQFVATNTDLIQAAVDVAINLQLRAGDAIYVALAHQLNVPLVSWDKEQLQKASTIITTYTPATYVFPQNESGEAPK